MSERLTWYKRYPRDFREGTRKLTLEERGFYGDVLDLIYENGDQLPDDDVANAHHLHLDVRTYRRVKAHLVELGKLQTGDGCLRNPRASTEASTAATRIAKAREAAKLGGENSRKSEGKANDFNGSGGADAKAKGPAVAKQTTDRRLQTQTPREDSENHTHTENKKGGKPPRSYAFQGPGKMRLTQADFDAWETAYRHLNLRAKLQQRADWYREKGEVPQSWFIATSNWLANENEEAAERIKARAEELLPPNLRYPPGHPFWSIPG